MIVTPETAEEVVSLLRQEQRYLAILAPKATTIEQLDRYLYGPALIWSLADANGHAGFVAVLTEHYAQATADRLGSGLYGASVHSSLLDATERLAELMF